MKLYIDCKNHNTLWHIVAKLSPLIQKKYDSIIIYVVNVFGFCSIHNKLFVLICVKNKTIGLSKCICLLCYLLHIAIWQNWYSLMGVKQDLLKKSRWNCNVVSASKSQSLFNLGQRWSTTLFQRCFNVVVPAGLRRHGLSLWSRPWASYSWRLWQMYFWCDHLVIVFCCKIIISNNPEHGDVL